jgi:hypothetical protein
MEVAFDLTRRIRVANWHLDPNVLPSSAFADFASQGMHEPLCNAEAESGAANLSIASCVACDEIIEHMFYGSSVIPGPVSAILTRNQRHLQHRHSQL